MPNPLSPALQSILFRWSKQPGPHADLRGDVLKLYGQTRTGRGKIVQSWLEPGRQKLHRLMRFLEVNDDGFGKPITNWWPYVRDTRNLIEECREVFNIAVEYDEHEDPPYRELKTLIASIEATLGKFQLQPRRQAHRAALLGILQAIVDRPPPKTLWERLE